MRSNVWTYEQILCVFISVRYSDLSYAIKDAKYYVLCKSAFFQINSKHL